MKLCYLLILAAAFAVGAASYGAAATLSVSSQSLGGGTTAVAGCDTDGVTFTARAIDSSHNVTSLTVSSINAACAGATLTVNLTDASNASLASGSVVLPASGFTGSATISFSGSDPAPSINNYRVAIVGP